MNKIGLVALIMILGVFVLAFTAVTDIRTYATPERGDMKRMTSYENLSQDTRMYIQNYWSLGLIVQALAILTVGAGVSMAIRGEEK